LLQAGDIVTIFSQADIHVPLAQQTKFVRLEGEFVHAGTYSVKPGETLPELVARAGGFSADAYLYGSEFTRQSTRAIQQQRINDYVRNLQMEISRGAIAQSSSAVTSAQDLASANAASTSERELIAQLPGKRMPPQLHGAFDAWICTKVLNVVHLIYQAKSYEEQYKDYAFGPLATSEHWGAGLADMQHVERRARVDQRQCRLNACRSRLPRA